MIGISGFAELITRTSRQILILGLLVLLLFYPSAVLGQSGAGALDTSFGTGGKVVTDLGGFDSVHALVAQNDGKIIAAGSDGPEFALARYNKDGTLDLSFGREGTIRTDFFSAGGGFEVANSVAIQPDGKIIAAGYANGGGTINFDFALARYNPDGSLDKGFGNGGKLTTEFQSFNSTEAAYALAIQSDGKIIVAGTCSSPLSVLNPVFGIARYNTDGSLDMAFGNGGKTTVTLVEHSDFVEVVHALAIQSDGKIIVTGFVSNDFGMARLNSDGNLDMSFGVGGKVRTDIGNRTDDALSIAVQPDGHILLAGRSIQGVSTEALALARYDADGTLDNGFGIEGRVIADFFPTGLGLFGDGLNCVIFQSDGKIIAAGRSAVVPMSDFGICRYNQDGTLDSSFGSAGKVVTDFGTSRFGGSRAVIYAIAQQPDGKIMAAGEDGSGDFALARYDVPVSSDFGLGFNATQLNAERGSSIRITVNINRQGGFNGSVTVTPPDATEKKIRFKPREPVSTIEATASFKAKIKEGASTGPQEVTFSAMDQSGRIRTASLTLRIQ
jgi:uncharacterized delta-60 repeat protein